MLAAYNITGGKLSGPAQDPNEDGYATKMALRTNYRRPIQETIDELGEGRGDLHDVSFCTILTFARHLWSWIC